MKIRPISGQIALILGHTEWELLSFGCFENISGLVIGALLLINPLENVAPDHDKF